ncbi:MAG: (Na+)-NQR maturation NqrM [Alcanivorax sp.]|uniref:(Na+)-NQR maturation NqrM n=1 Tax=Alloalcanivorax marinus TaxID=1177169 RepID=A0A9Q3UJX4_9GAMM|nr:(Na+)-NQR maturation NqrM [Alloalcanivorax marinus]MBM7334173.1 (Na+)-NQR maturation NqrM [Alloalcanivorax marinus]MCC4308601.1 (Na+)-NQR maturation NqrM [Alloalcanivorax marinus]
MLGTILAAFVVLALLFAGMAIGVILSNKPLKGSCGGLAALGMKDGCEICGGDKDACEENTRQVSAKRAAELGRDVLKT